VNELDFYAAFFFQLIVYPVKDTPDVISSEERSSKLIVKEGDFLKSLSFFWYYQFVIPKLHQV
jgi:hypothetical protein